jgi:hypothetical protein
MATTFRFPFRRERPQILIAARRHAMPPILASGLVLALAAGAAASDVTVLPGAWEHQRGSGSNSRLLNETPGVHQAVFAASLLSAIPHGSRIEGIAWRLGGTTANAGPWPPAPVTFGEYNIQVSTSLHPPGSLSNVFDNNIAPDVVLARSGPLEFAAHAFPGAPAPTPAPFGPVVEFSTPFIYNGGDLLITMRRSGYISGSGAAFCDRLITGDPGYNVEFQGHHRAGSISEVTSAFQALFIFQITFSVDSCYADCDGNNILNVDDFICFINAFASQDPYADCDGNQTYNVDDFLCFINEFAQGCP